MDKKTRTSVYVGKEGERTIMELDCVVRRTSIVLDVKSINERICLLKIKIKFGAHL